jgi:copper transport protein
VVRLFWVVGLLAALLVMPAVPAAAHTDLESSTPAAGAKIDGPLDTLTLRFTQPIDLAGKGVQILDGTGTAVDADTAVDGAVVTVHPERALRAGRYGVRWAVRAGDAHPVRDTFAFTVTGPARPADTATEQAAEAAAATTADPPADGADAGLDAALASDPLRAIRYVDRVLRAIFYVVALATVGVLVFMLAAWEGSRREARRLARLVGRLAMATVVVVLAQALVGTARTAGGWSGLPDHVPSMLSGGYAVGMASRVIGAALIVAGIGSLRRSLCTEVAPIAGGAVDVLAERPQIAQVPAMSPAARMRSAPTAFIGALLIIASFAVVGHAATVQPRLVAALADVAHVTAASVWGGGLLALVLCLSGRRRAHEPPRTGLVATRFSVLATFGVIVAAAAGIALAMVRLDAPSDVWTTAYGLVLVGKVTVVSVVAGLGAYNHFIVVPALRRDADRRSIRHLRRVGLLEVMLLVAVGGLTSVLVALAG